MTDPAMLIVPGLRDHAPRHWQTELARRWPGARQLEPMGRDNLSLEPRLQALEAAVAAASRPVLLVAHSGGCVLVAHWARHTGLGRRVMGALLATPPTFDAPLPPPYPSLQALDAAGWLPVPHSGLPFPSIIAASRNDPLGKFLSVSALARDWGGVVEDLGAVGHLNPASGFGPWPAVDGLIRRLMTPTTRERIMEHPQ